MSSNRDMELMPNTSYEQLLTIANERRREDKHMAWLSPVSLLLAITMHLLLLQINNPATEMTPRIQKETIFDVALIYEAQAAPVEQAVESPQPPAEPEPEPEPEIIPEKPKQPPIIKPLKKAVVLPKKTAPKAPRVERKPVTTAQKIVPKRKVVEMPPASIAAVTPTMPAYSPEQIKALRQQYLARIMRIIESRKSYPFSARRRHVEGDIHVSFVINAKGHISDIQIDGKSELLCSCTMDAVRSSGSLPKPPAELNGNIHAKLIMRYRLK